MVNLSKSKLQCQICGKILNDPVHLPCYCTICQVHLTDSSVKYGLIKCEPCGEKFVVKGMQLKTNKYAQFILDSDGYLSPEEKSVKLEMQKLLKNFSNSTINFNKIRLHLNSARTIISPKLSAKLICRERSRETRDDIQAKAGRDPLFQRFQCWNRDFRKRISQSRLDHRTCEAITDEVWSEF